MAATLLRFVGTFSTFAGSRFWAVLALIFAGALTEGVGLVLLLPVLQLMSEATPSGITLWLVTTLSAVGIETLHTQLAALIGLVTTLIILRAGLAWLRSIYLMQIEIDFVNHLRLTLFSSLAHARWPQLSGLQFGEAQNSLVQDLSRLSQATTSLMRSVVNGIVVTVQLMVSVLIAPGLTLIIIAIGTICALLLPRLMRKSQDYGQRQTRAGHAFHNHLLNFFSALKLMKIQKEEPHYIAFFQTRMLDLRTEMLGFVRNSAGFQLVFQITSAVLICVVMGLGIFVLDMQLSLLIAVVVIVARASGPAITVVRSMQATAYALPAFVAYEDMVQRLTHTGTHDQGGSSGANSPSRPPRISATDLCFQHSDRSNTLVTNLTFDVEPGQIVSFAGPSGSGKTTLLDLISGLLEPTSGQISVTPHSQTGPGQPSGLAYVTQETVLFDISIRDNLTFGLSENVSEAQIEQVLR
ncbi:MAG: ABC transporter ATP-binding protein, partial [Pseudomonadota bacterium]